MSKITQLNLDGALFEVKDPRFENDKFFQYNLGTISETPDTSQNETLQKIYDAAASGGSVMAIYDGILLDVSEVSADKMVLSSSSGLTFLKINVTVTAGAVTEAVRISTTPIIYGETDYEDGVTPLPTGTIYCYWENPNHKFNFVWTDLMKSKFTESWDIDHMYTGTVSGWDFGEDAVLAIAPFLTDEWFASADESYVLHGHIQSTDGVIDIEDDIPFEQITAAGRVQFKKEYDDGPLYIQIYPEDDGEIRHVFRLYKILW